MSAVNELSARVGFAKQSEKPCAGMIEWRSLLMSRQRKMNSGLDFSKLYFIC